MSSVVTDFFAAVLTVYALEADRTSVISPTTLLAAGVTLFIVPHVIDSAMLLFIANKALKDDDDNSSSSSSSSDNKSKT